MIKNGTGWSTQWHFQTYCGAYHPLVTSARIGRMQKCPGTISLNILYFIMSLTHQGSFENRDNFLLKPENINEMRTPVFVCECSWTQCHGSTNMSDFSGSVIHLTLNQALVLCVVYIAIIGHI